MKHFAFFSLIALAIVALFTLNTPAFAQATTSAVTTTAPAAAPLDLDEIEKSFEGRWNKVPFDSLDLFYTNKYPGIDLWIEGKIKRVGDKRFVNMPGLYKGSVIHQAQDQLTKVDTTLDKVVMPAVESLITLAKANAAVTNFMVNRDSTLSRQLTPMKPFEPPPVPKPTAAQAAWKTLQDFLK